MSLGIKVGLLGEICRFFVATKICSHDVCIEIYNLTNCFTKMVSFLLLLDDPSWKSTREMDWVHDHPLHCGDLSHSEGDSGHRPAVPKETVDLIYS